MWFILEYVNQFKTLPKSISLYKSDVLNTRHILTKTSKYIKYNNIQLLSEYWTYLIFEGSEHGRFPNALNFDEVMIKYLKIVLEKLTMAR